MTTLNEAARTAGMMHSSVLELARGDLQPDAAVADLKTRYPDAFAKHARDMTPAEMAAFEKKIATSAPMKVAHADKKFADMTVQEKEEFERSIGVPQNWGDVMARRRTANR